VKFRAAALCLVLVALPAQATDRWSFDTKLAVTGEPVSGVYPHLDGAGRKHIAIASEAVAATWEDNRSGAPQVYVALKANDRNRFAIASLPQNRFALAWEQDGSIHARVLTDDGLGMPVALGSAGASHVSLASFGSRVFASWREQRDRLWFVKVAALSVTAAGKLGVESITSVEAAGLETQVLFPSIAVNDAGLSVAWEDRRAGHTRLLVSHSPDQAQSFGEPQHLNEFLSNRNQYDQGNGVTRVSLASFAQDEILAAWMDKRRGGLGYGIFAALGSDGGAIFGPNEKVHGEAGDKQPHYNPAVAGNPDGDFVVAWDDFRRGDSDIWLSAYNEDDEWSQDFSPAIASGAGEQSHPSIALDDQGRLHLLWIERADMDAPGRLWYSRAIPR
jgi:hypothetical protein